MAKPIKETPVLLGKDAELFIRENKEVKKISKKEKDKIKNDFETLSRIAAFGI